MGGAEHHSRHSGVAAFLFGDRNADGGMRIDQIAGFAQNGASARSALKEARIADSADGDTMKRRDCANEFIRFRTAFPSRPQASNRSRSKFDETWMSMDGDVVATTSRNS